MREYELNGMKVVYNNDRKMGFPIGVKLSGELVFLDLETAICLRRFLKKAIKKAANAKNTNSW